MTVPNRGDDRIVHSIGRAQSEFPAGVVEHIDCASLSVGELCSLGDDGGKDRLEVDARIDCLSDLAERAQLADRLAELARARLYFVEQPRVLDRDHRLIREGGKQLDLLVGERAHGGAR
jgi:hypothetical protein